jgi:hypothetical protein
MFTSWLKLCVRMFFGLGISTNGGATTDPPGQN